VLAAAVIPNGPVAELDTALPVIESGSDEMGSPSALVACTVNGPRTDPAGPPGLGGLTTERITTESFVPEVFKVEASANATGRAAPADAVTVGVHTLAGKR
jgi:hypothetical protein